MFEAFDPTLPWASALHHTRHRLISPALSLKGQKVPIEKRGTVNLDRESLVEAALYCKTNIWRMTLAIKLPGKTFTCYPARVR